MGRKTDPGEAGKAMAENIRRAQAQAEPLRLDTRVTFGDFVREVVRDANKAKYHDAAAAFHSVAVSLGELKRACEAAERVAADSSAGERLREFIAEL